MDLITVNIPLIVVGLFIFIFLFLLRLVIYFTKNKKSNLNQIEVKESVFLNIKDWTADEIEKFKLEDLQFHVESYEESYKNLKKKNALLESDLQIFKENITKLYEAKAIDFSKIRVDNKVTPIENFILTNIIKK